MKRYKRRSKSFVSRLKKLFRNKLSIWFVPHSTARSYQLQFSFSFVLFCLVFWTGLTSWASWAVFSNVDYWSMKLDHQVLQFKVEYFAKELKRSREFLEQVQEADTQLRQLLGMKSRQTIIESTQGQGGPEAFQSSILTKTLENRLWEITPREIHLASHQLYKEVKERLTSFKEISAHIARQRGLFRSTPKGWPARGRLTSKYGPRISPMHGGRQFHTGIDVANVKGTSIYATADGQVRHAGWEGGYGRLIVIDHGFGYATFYGHNSKLLVKKGDRVKQGQIIAEMGSSGNSTGDHVHYEIWRYGRYINPTTYLKEPKKKRVGHAL